MGDNPLPLQTDKQKKIEEISVFERDRQLSDLREIMALPAGRRTFWRFLEQSRWMQDSFSSQDAGFTTARNTGRQSFGLWMFSEFLEAKDDFLIQMTREHKSELIRKNKKIKEIEQGE